MRMNIIIKGTHTDVSGGVRTLVESKFANLAKMVGAEGTQLTCELEESIAVERAGAKYRAEGNLSVNGKLFRAEATGVTLEAAVDRVRDELTREVHHSHGKARHILKRGGAAMKSMLRGFRG